MTFLLSSQNVFDYLIEKGLCNQEEKIRGVIEAKSAKNFNLLLTLPKNRNLLIKQEPHYGNGETAGEFLREWRIQEFLQHFEDLNDLQAWFSEGLYFDVENSILVFNYLSDHRDLEDFYSKEKVFSVKIATSIGRILAAIHRTTLRHPRYYAFFSTETKENSNLIPNWPDLQGKRIMSISGNSTHLIEKICSS
jgi:hypothetical protein